VSGMLPMDLSIGKSLALTRCGIMNTGLRPMSVEPRCAIE
jgi:hypothetical protein